MTNVVEIGRVVVNGTPKIAAREVDAAGNPGAVLVSWNVVDDSIGASYCRISMNDECMLKAELLDKSGYLWINQREYVCKNGITRDDQIYFGEKKIKLEVSKFIGAVWGYDISHLKDVWDKYKETQEKLRKKDILMKKLGSLPTYILLVAAAATGAAGHDLGIWRWIIMIAFLLGTALYEFFKSDTLSKKLEGLREKFVDEYVCPSCGAYIGDNKTWNMLSKTDACPYCKAKFYQK
jgi:predicted RNA-binding Zn-ribbon protein involved in translation (DUF1610 family)